MSFNKIYYTNYSDLHSMFGIYQLFVQESRYYFRIFAKGQDSELQHHIGLATVYKNLSDDFIFCLEPLPNHQYVSQTT